MTDFILQGVVGLVLGLLSAVAVISALTFLAMAFKGGLSVYNENVALRLDKLERENVQLLRMVNEARDYSDGWASELNNKINIVKSDVELMKEDE